MNLNYASGLSELVLSIRQREQDKKGSNIQGSLPANLRTGATITNKRPSCELANLKSISVPPRSAIDTGT